MDEVVRQNGRPSFAITDVLSLCGSLTDATARDGGHIYVIQSL